MTTVKVKLLTPTAKLPAYQTDGAAGMDLCADISEPLLIWDGHAEIVGTGLSIEIPPGYEGQVRPRSGLAFKKGVFAFNGTIDHDFRGEVKVLLENRSGDSFCYTVQPGERIAQMVIAPVVRATIEQVGELSSTERGAGGFGSTDGEGVAQMTAPSLKRGDPVTLLSHDPSLPHEHAKVMVAGKHYFTATGHVLPYYVKDEGESWARGHVQKEAVQP